MYSNLDLFCFALHFLYRSYLYFVFFRHAALSIIRVLYPSRDSDCLCYVHDISLISLCDFCIRATIDTVQAAVHVQ